MKVLKAIEALADRWSKVAAEVELSLKEMIAEDAERAMREDAIRRNAAQKLHQKLAAKANQSRPIFEGLGTIA